MRKHIPTGTRCSFKDISRNSKNTDDCLERKDSELNGRTWRFTGNVANLSLNVFVLKVDLMGDMIKKRF